MPWRSAAQVLLGTVVYMWLEDWSAVDAVYFSVVTLATVGYGDLHPTTTAAKLFTVAYILFGLGIIATFITELAKHHAAAINQVRARVAHPDLDPGTPSPDTTAPPATDDPT